MDLIGLLTGFKFPFRMALYVADESIGQSRVLGAWGVFQRSN